MPHDEGKVNDGWEKAMRAGEGCVNVGAGLCTFVAVYGVWVVEALSIVSAGEVKPKVETRAHGVHVMLEWIREV